VTDVDNARGARSLPMPVLWGIAVGVIQAASPLGLAWLEPATVYALGLGVIATVYVGFAVADGRPRVIVIEFLVAAVFVVLASVSVTATAWILVIGYAGHGVKDLWQERHHFV